MENKKYIVGSIIIICFCFLLIGYFNYEKIVNFLNDKEWELAEAFATINLENVNQVESGKALLILGNNNLKLYDNSGQNDYSEEMITTGVLTSACEDYLVVVSKDTNGIYLFKDTELVWKNNFNWKILNISVNKNGYVTVIYSQSGYKSSIKIFKPAGDELFTTYLASTYAIDVEMSNDNKTLYIAEIDAEGIKIKSNIKIIDVANIEYGTTSNQKVETILVGTDELITDINYVKDKLFILKDSGIASIDLSKNINTIGEFEAKNTLFASITDLSFPMIIEKVSTGIFTNETNLKIFKDDEVLEIKIEKTPQNIDTMNNKIALNLGDEVLFLNMNGKILKRYELDKQLITVKMYNKGNVAALVFRDKIELVKI